MTGPRPSERQTLISLYASRLKELNHTPFSRQDIRDLERTAERFSAAVEHAVRGDRNPLNRHIQQLVLQRGKEGYKFSDVLESLEAFRLTARLVPSVWGSYADLDDVLHWSILRFSHLYEEVQSERGLIRMMESLTLALDSKDGYTSSHSQSVQKIGEKFARILGVEIGLAGLFHDIGKIHVPDYILCKSEPLTPEEWAQLRQHPYHSFRILSPAMPHIASICLRHHERPDGKGYPMGDSNVTLESNVISAADTLHAICSTRSYRGAQRLDKALSIIRGGRGTQFLPEVVDAVDTAYGDMGELLFVFAPAQDERSPSA